MGSLRERSWIAVPAAALVVAAVWFGAAPRPVTVVAVGDFLLDRGVKERIDRGGRAALVTSVRPLIQHADIAVCNLECPLASGNPTAPKPVIFSGPAVGAAWLREAGFRAVCIANNHALDQGREGLLQTMASLHNAGVTCFGAGTDQAEACRPRIIRCRGKRIGLLGFTVFPDEGVFFDPAKPGTARADPEAVERAVRCARRRADLVIVSFHWGNEFHNLASDSQRRLGRLAVDSGADLVVGHHPHVIQGAELYHGRLIAYSLGNFVFDQHRRGANRALALRITFQGSHGSAAFEPIEVVNCFPRRPRRAARRYILREFRALCDGLGTTVRLSADSACIDYPLRGGGRSTDNG